MIETKRLIIREGSDGDYESSKAIWMVPEVRKYSGGVPSEESFRKAFYEDARTDRGEWAFRSVVEKESGKHIGDAGIIQKHVDGRDETEVVYFFNKDYWGRGYATEAARALLEYGFGKLGLKRVIALIHPENEPSMKVAGRVGMKFEKDVVTDSGNPRKLFAVEKLP